MDKLCTAENIYTVWDPEDPLLMLERFALSCFPIEVLLES